MALSVRDDVPEDCRGFFRDVGELLLFVDLNILRQALETCAAKVRSLATRSVLRLAHRFEGAVSRIYKCY